jgi:hypothetical protein
MSRRHCQQLHIDNAGNILILYKVEWACFWDGNGYKGCNRHGRSTNLALMHRGTGEVTKYVPTFRAPIILRAELLEDAVLENSVNPIFCFTNLLVLLNSVSSCGYLIIGPKPYDGFLGDFGLHLLDPTSLKSAV